MDGRDPVKGKGVTDGNLGQHVNELQDASTLVPWPLPGEGSLAITVDGAFGEFIVYKKMFTIQ